MNLVTQPQTFSLALDTLHQALCKSWKLTPREAEVLKLMMNGKTASSEIGDELSIAFATTQRHLESICIKSGNKGRKEIVSVLFRLYERLLTFLEREVVAGNDYRMVYIVDDDPDICSILSTCLTGSGFQPVTHFDQPRLLGDLSRKPPLKVVIYDLTYPVDDVQGLFFGQAGAALPKDDFVRIAMTGFPKFVDDYQDRLLYHSLLMKPFQRVDAVDSVLRAILMQRSRDVVDQLALAT